MRCFNYCDLGRRLNEIREKEREREREREIYFICVYTCLSGGSMPSFFSFLLPFSVFFYSVWARIVWRKDERGTERTIYRMGDPRSVNPAVRVTEKQEMRMHDLTT